MIRPQDFYDWISKAEIGEDIVYHVGTTVASNHGRTMTGQVAWNAAKGGQVFLYRQRCGKDRFRFCARRVSRRAGEVLKPHEMELGR